MGIRVGLIGYGFIGRGIAMALHQGKGGDARLVAVLDQEPESFRTEQEVYPWKFTGNLSEFLAQETDLVVEAAGQGAVRRYAVECLRSGRDLLTMSVGAFADDALLAQVKEAAVASGRRVIVPSGAIGGLDILAAAAIGGLDEVVVTTTSPARSGRGSAAGHLEDPSKLTEPVCLFDGPAREAVRLFPHNVNIHAAASFAGLGLDATRSRICVDPSLNCNRQEIEARGYFGEMKVSITNTPLVDYRMTGRVVVLSVMNTIRKLYDSWLVVG